MGSHRVRRDWKDLACTHTVSGETEAGRERNKHGMQAVTAMALLRLSYLALREELRRFTLHSLPSLERFTGLPSLASSALGGHLN